MIIKSELCILNTNNVLEGQFVDLKIKFRNHNNQRQKRKVFIG